MNATAAPIDLKTFDELTLSNLVYVMAPDEMPKQISVYKIQVDEDSRSKTKIEFAEWKDDAVSFPDGEHFFQDADGCMYTTSKDVYKSWQKPFVEKEILKQEARIAELILEIEELKKSIQ